MGRPECQPGVEAVAALFNSWKMESRRIRDRLQEIRVGCVRIGPGNRRVLVYPQKLGRPAER